MTDEQARKARAEARRATWTIRRVAREDDLPPTADTPEERLDMVYELTMRAWALSGKPLPTYTRATMPTRIIRPRKK